ncbi:MAG: endonuclease MutS2 [Chloroflexi bacterium]|nr:endonuclease MutS2 [Chloroflexota bacterium]MDA1226768.1 endonuclease MutS2 [Chloroflexota bacterium]
MDSRYREELNEPPYYEADGLAVEAVPVEELQQLLKADSEQPHGTIAKSLELLEYNVIRERLAEHVTFFPARNLVLRMFPSYAADEVADMQRETAEGRALLDEGGDVNLHTTLDISTSVARASLGGVLTGQELLNVAEALEIQRRARSGVMRVGNHAPTLREMAEGIPDLQELSRQIRTRIGNRGEVVDDATHNLRALRSQIRQAYERVTAALTDIIQSPSGVDVLQDNVISVRNDRLVVQVKSEMRSRLPGIVHDASNTGATLFVEPFTTVDMGNNWRELGFEEQREVLRVLRDLSTLIGETAPDIRRGNETTARLDFILARARYGYAMRAVAAIPIRTADAGRREEAVAEHRLINARHPLLGRDATPITISIGPDWSVLVVTGPNTGGKTVAMKTVGLLTLMHQSGLQVPADDGTSLPIFDGVFADVGDQQSIEQSVSTFSSHMRNVVDILEEATPNSLVLLDELGTSTDPEEGSALAKAILERLADQRISTIVTTHHRSVATFAEANDSMMNASVQLNPTTLSPTYHLTMGIPGRSYAMAVAASLGLPEDIMENARSLMEPQHLRFEDWLNELQRDREQLQTRMVETEQTRAEIQQLRQQLREQVDYLVNHREDIMDSIRRQLLAQYEEVRRKLRRAETALSWSAPRGAPTTTAQEVARIRQELDEQKPVLVGATQYRPLEARAMAVGDQVHIRGLNLVGAIGSLPEKGGEAQVIIGKVRIQVDASRLTPVDQPNYQPRPLEPGVTTNFGPMLETSELDLRGLRSDEAIIRVEDFLDKAVRDGFSSVRIIHGKGTGALRQAVRDHLARQPLARSFEAEARERGGNGATLVELA